jgi:hypothetical protein
VQEYLNSGFARLCSFNPSDVENTSPQWHAFKFCAKTFPNILPGTLAFYRIVNISNDQQMSLISHFRSFNSSFQKCRLKIANREWKN